MARRSVNAMLTLSLVLVAKISFAQLPAAKLLELFPSGGNAGKSFDVTVYGVDLDDAKQLTFSHSGITAAVKMAEPGPFDKGPQPVPNTFVVTVAANVPLGVYEAHVAGKYGLSNPRAFTIGDIPECLRWNRTTPRSKQLRSRCPRS